MNERTIGTIKQLLRKADDPYVAFMEYRNTPVTGIGLSPSQMLNSRRLKSKLPTTVELLRPQVTLNAREKLVAAQQRQTFYYDRHAMPLKGLEPEENVRVRENRSWVPAVVTDIWPTPRSYVVKTESGTSLRRNRNHLLKQPKSTNKCVSPSDEMEVATLPERSSINTSPERSL